MTKFSGDDEDLTEWWEEMAGKAMIIFSDKEAYMEWVNRLWTCPKNRFAASVCWDIIKLEESQRT